MIEFRDVSVTAVAADTVRTILHPFSLALTERRVSIIGANGSGKSTFARLINGLTLPSAGEVVVGADAERDGQPFTALRTDRDGAKVRRIVGYLFTNPAAQLIMPTVIEDISLSLRHTHRDSASRRDAARSVLARLGISDLEQQSVHTLSGGQQQLVALASVLALEPAIVVADEPTTLLDLQNSLMIAKQLGRLSQQLIVVTHDLELAQQAERTLVMHEGRIAFDGEPREAVERYRELVSQS